MTIGRNDVLIGVAVLVIVLIFAIPLLLSGGKAGRLDHVMGQVDSLRQAQLVHMEAFGEFVSAEASPRAPRLVDATPVHWIASEGFAKLAWSPQPHDEVYASYAVAVTADGFRVIGTSDLDGDGQRAVVEATQDDEAFVTTPSGVY
ncbi:MAG: hypothetical protein KTR31_03310 [Myxococcales bacterium]|nr:hypothetical protein [Myxococcales bacterium]